MKKTLLQLTMLFALMGSWCMQANAAWRFKTNTPITKASQLKDGMLIAIENRCCADATGKLWSAPNTYEPYNTLSQKYAFKVTLLPEKNAFTHEPMILLQSVETNKWYVGDDGFAGATKEDAIVLTVGQASLYTDWQYNKADGWTEDNPQWKNSGRVPAWDWKKGGEDALTFAGNVESSNPSNWYFLGQVWGWSSYNYIWYSSSGNDVNPFYAYELEEFEDWKGDLTALLSECESGNYVDVFVPGEGVGFYGEEEVKAFNEAYTKAKEVMKQETPTSEEMRAAYEELKKTVDAALASLVEMHNGYFYLVSGHPGYFDKQGVYKAMYDNGEKPMWKTLEENNPIFVFKCESEDNVNYLIQNLATSRYIDGVSKTSTTAGLLQHFDKIGNGQYNIKDDSGTYHTQSHAEGAGTSGAIVAWNGLINTGSSWVLREITDKVFLDSLLNVVERQKLEARFTDALNNLRNTYNAGFVEKWYIHDVAQLSSNAEEPGEGSLEGLLDKNDKTFFHSTYSRNDVKEPHYLQVKLDEALQHVSIYWKKRMDNNSDRPTKMTLFGSNDGTSFVQVAELPAAPDTFPTAAETLEYFSPKSIDMGRPYEYLRFRVDATNSPDRVCNGIEYFTFSEFNLSDEGFPLDTLQSLGIREDMKEAYAALNEAIKVAAAKELSKVTEEDIDEIQAAIDAFGVAYPDTSLLVEAIKETEKFISEMIIPEEGVAPQIGECADLNAVEQVRIMIASMKANLATNDKITRAEINDQIRQLKEAEQTLIASVAYPEMNKWYYIVNRSNGLAYKPQGCLVYPSAKKVGAGLMWGSSVEEEGAVNPDYIWTFIPSGEEDGSFYVRNVGSGFYMGECLGASVQYQLSETPVAFKCTYITGGQLTLVQNVEDASPIHAAYGNTLVSWGAVPDNGSVWTFIPASEEQGALSTIKENTADVFCLPYDVYNSFYAYDDETGEAATIAAYNVAGGHSEKGQNMDKIGLSKMAENEVITAGTPFILVCGSLETAPAKELVLDMGIAVDSEISTEAKSAEGLIGVFKETELTSAQFAYFTAGKLQAVKEGESVKVAAQRGYIDGMQITKNYENADLVLTMENGIISGVEGIEIAADALVSVYTVDGQLLRKNVERAAAVKGLKKGVYIINGEKVLVP